MYKEYKVIIKYFEIERNFNCFIQYVNLFPRFFFAGFCIYVLYIQMNYTKYH